MKKEEKTKRGKKKRKFQDKNKEEKGGNKGIRTLGPCLAKAVLYQLSYIPSFSLLLSLLKFFLSTQVDLVEKGESKGRKKRKKKEKKLDHTGLEPVNLSLIKRAL